jgi:exopolysaccharide production protein ExoQ
MDIDKQPERPWIGLWVPIVWYSLEASQSVTRWLALMTGRPLVVDSMDGSPLDRSIYIGLMILALLILVKRKIRWGELIQSNRALTVLFLYMLVSIVWSDVPGVSFRRWVRTLIDGLMALVVLTDRAPFAAESSLIRRVMYVHLALSVIFIKYFRTLGIGWDEFGDEMWVGITTHKNTLGQVAMIGGIYFVLELIRNWRQRRMLVKLVYFGYLGLILWLLRGAPSHRSNTAIFGLAIGITVLFGLQFLKGRVAYLRRYFVLAAAAAALVFLLAAADRSLLAAVTSASGRDVTLTGRTDLWTDLLDIAAKHPILGVGYGSFWIGNTHNLWEKHMWGPTQGHNGYIDVYLELGVVGLLVLAAVIIAAYFGALDRMTANFRQGGQGMLHFAWLTVIVIHNVTESSYLRGTVDLWFIYLLCAIRVPPWREAAVPEATAPVLSGARPFPAGARPFPVVPDPQLRPAIHGEAPLPAPSRPALGSR